MIYQSQLTLERSCAFDLLRLDWSSTLIYHDRELVLMPSVLAISLFDKYRLRNIMNNTEIQIDIMARQGNHWYSLIPSPPPSYSPIARQRRNRLNPNRLYEAINTTPLASPLMTPRPYPRLHRPSSLTPTQPLNTSADNISTPPSPTSDIDR